MRLSLLSLALAPIALAQSSSSASAASPSASGASGNSSQYLQQLLGALTQANLTGLVSVASSIANDTAGQALIAQLAVGNKTVFAPSNDALSALPQNVTSNTTLLVETLAYHILNNTYTVNGTKVLPNHTIARTLLKGDGYSLPGNFSAPLVLARNSTNATSFEIVQYNANITATGPAAAANLLVYVVDQVLSLPPSIATLATSLFPTLAGVIQQAGLLDPLASAQGITVFAPSDAVLSGAQSALGSLNSTQLTDLLANHVINGSVAYSTNIGTGNYTSAAGEPFKFTTNSTGTFVTSANSTAQIIQSDIIIQNGVVHVIDGVLLNTASNSTAAAAAYSSGIAAAQTSSEPTAPVTATSSPAASGSASGSSSSKAAAGQVAPLSWSNGLVGTVLAVAGVVFGSGYVLM